MVRASAWTCSLRRPLASSGDQPLVLVVLAQDFAEAGVIDAPGALVVAGEVVVLEGAAGVGVDAHGKLCVAVDAIAQGDGVAVAHDRQAAVGMGDDVIILQGDDAFAAEEDAPSTTIVDAVTVQQNLFTGGDVDRGTVGLGADVAADHFDVATRDDEAIEMLAAELA